MRRFVYCFKATYERQNGIYEKNNTKNKRKREKSENLLLPKEREGD